MEKTIVDAKGKRRSVFFVLVAVVGLMFAVLLRSHASVPVSVRLYVMLLLLPVSALFGWYWMGIPIRDFERRNRQQ